MWIFKCFLVNLIELRLIVIYQSVQNMHAPHHYVYYPWLSCLILNEYLKISKNSPRNVQYNFLRKSNWIGEWNLAFPVFISPIIVWNVWKSSLGIALFQKATKRPRMLTDNRQSGGSYSVNY